MFLRKYNTLTVTGTTAIRIPIIKRGVVDFAVSADWTPAAGDVKIAIDGAAAANVTNLPTAVTMGNTAYWEFILTAAELTCKSCVVTVADSATKAVEDQAFIVETFGHASAMYQADLSAANLPANATQFAGQTITAAAGVTLPSSVASPTNITAATGVVLSGVTHTGAVIPTVSVLTGHTPQTGDSFARIGAAGAGLTAVDDAILAAIAALNNLSAAQVTAAVPTTAQIAAAVDVALINTGDGADLLQAIANQIAADWVAGDASPLAVAAAVRTNLATELARIDAAVSTRASQTSVDDVPTNAELATALGTADDATLAAIAAEAVKTAAIKTKTDQLTFTVANKVDTTAVLDPAVGTQITAIETFATRMTTGLVQDGEVYQFTANMLELGPAGGGGSTVNVLPATGIVADRSAGTTLNPVVGETISQSITVYQSDGTTAVSLSGKTLKVIFETMSGVDVAVVLAADITISGASSNVVTFAYPSAVTASERTLRFAIRDAAAPLTMYLQGVCSVVAAPKVDA